MAGFDDKILRVRTGTELLRRIKENGGTAAEVAKFIEISPTTLSHWQSGDPDRLKRVGAPTDAQLQKLVGYLCHKVKSNQENLQRLVMGGVIRHREQMMLLKSLEKNLDRWSQDWASARNTKEQQIDDFISRLKEYHESNSDDPKPQEYWDDLMRFCSHMNQLPSQEDLAEGLITWDFDNLKRHMRGFDEGVKVIEGMLEEGYRDEEAK